MLGDFSEVITIKKTKKYLKIGKPTLYKMTREGKNIFIKIESIKNNGIVIPIYDFITYLLESRVNLHYIQELLGHKSRKTTEIYTYVSTKNLGVIKSPLDRIFERGET